MIDREPLQGAPNGAPEPGVASLGAARPFDPNSRCQAQPSATGIMGNVGPGRAARVVPAVPQTKAGAIEPQLAGRLAHILGLLIGSYRDREFEGRLDKLESPLRAPTATTAPGARP